MNPVIAGAAASVSMGWLAGLMTIVFLACFLGWVWYAYNPQRRELMDEAARIPFLDGGEG